LLTVTATVIELRLHLIIIKFNMAATIIAVTGLLELVWHIV
jgi:hypothetical protein